MTTKATNPASREEIVQFFTKQFAKDDNDGFSKAMIEVLADEAIEDNLSIEEMERNIANNSDLEEKLAKVRESGQPILLMRADAKTGEKLLALNLGTFGTIIPNELTLFHDLYTALFRLSQDREWIPYVEICENIECTEYVQNWHMNVYTQIYYAESEGILELRGDDSNLEVKLVRKRKTNIIKQFVTSFDRPEISFLSTEPY